MGYTAKEIDAVVDQLIASASHVYVKIGNERFTVIAAMPVDESGQSFTLIQLDNPKAETMLVLGAEAKAALFEGKIPTTPVKAQVIATGEPGLHGEVTITQIANQSLQIKGTLNKEGSTEVFPLEAVLHESASGMGGTKIAVVGNEFRMRGTLGTISYKLLKDSIAQNPHVKTLVLEHIDGSVNDEVNMHTGRLVRKAGLTTRVLKDSEIASGAVDLFASGSKRIVQRGATLGVHSWCCVEGKTAADLPEDHSGHTLQLEYFTEMMGPKLGPDFYFFTLRAAPFDGVKNMTEQEILNYNLATEITN